MCHVTHTAGLTHVQSQSRSPDKQSPQRVQRLTVERVLPTATAAVCTANAIPSTHFGISVVSSRRTRISKSRAKSRLHIVTQPLTKNRDRNEGVAIPVGPSCK